MKTKTTDKIRFDIEFPPLPVFYLGNLPLNVLLFNCRPSLTNSLSVIKSLTPAKPKHSRRVFGLPPPVALYYRNGFLYNLVLLRVVGQFLHARGGGEDGLFRLEFQKGDRHCFGLRELGFRIFLPPFGPLHFS